MTHGSLFSGIGGFDLAASWLGWKNLFQVEIDGYCRKVLERHFPDTTRYGDIREFDGREWADKVDILSGGFPCPPWSQMGRHRRGSDDPRYLWPEMLRVVRQCRPAWVVCENVVGFVAAADGLERCAVDLENASYQVWAGTIPAAAVGAHHWRKRAWVVAHAGDERRTEHGLHQAQPPAAARPDSGPLSVWANPAPPVGSVCGVADGLPGGLDRCRRIRALGNAIVPQVALAIFEAIDRAHECSQGLPTL